MKRLFMGLCFCLLLGLSAAQTKYDLELYLNDTVIDWQEKINEKGRVTIDFEGGSLDLNLADWNTFTYAHVLATEFRRTSEDTYNVSTTVRHNDTGWDNYADAFEVKGETVTNGLRVLMHPHETEQPFTRSQSSVQATGLVHVEAKDNVEGVGGSIIYLDLEAFKEADSIRISYEISLR